MIRNKCLFPGVGRDLVICHSGLKVWGIDIYLVKRNERERIPIYYLPAQRINSNVSEKYNVVMFRAEDGDNMFLRNVGNYLTSSHVIATQETNIDISLP
jgi:hypothetical protein